MGDKRSITVTTDIEDYQAPTWTNADKIVLHALAGMFTLTPDKRKEQRAQFDAWVAVGQADLPQPPKPGYIW